MKSSNIRFILIAVFSLLAGEARAADRSTLIKHILQSIQQQYAPDRRTAVFDISYKQTETEIILSGEVGTLAAKTAVIDALQKKLKKEVIDRIRVLPDTTMGSKKYGIILSDVENILGKPSKQGGLLTQALMGTVVTILKKETGYYFIQMPDQYLGWIDTTALYRTDSIDVSAWDTAQKVIMTALTCVIHKDPLPSSEPLCIGVAGCILKSGGKHNGWVMVEFADGRKGFVLDSLIQDFDAWKKSRVLTGETLEQTARTLLNIPYLWGGTSVKGMDCSGFIKIVFRFNGRELPRDADQQANQGMHIDPGNNFENLQKGDLLFFGQESDKKQTKRITHVGLSLGNRLFIHSSGRVRLSSFDPSSNYFEEPLLKRFIRARRIIQE